MSSVQLVIEEFNKLVDISNFRDKIKAKEQFAHWISNPSIHCSAFGVTTKGWRKRLSGIYGQLPDGKYLKYAILLSKGLRPCSMCNSILAVESFYQGVGHCTSCMCQRSKSYRDDNHDRYKNRYRFLEDARYYSNKRRAAKLQRTPKWANMGKIMDIYKKCPEGYHVDHIVPLQGNSVCGLHVEYNLQYLTAAENLEKSNKLLSP